MILVTIRAKATICWILTLAEKSVTSKSFSETTVFNALLRVYTRFRQA